MRIPSHESDSRVKELGLCSGRLRVVRGRQALAAEEATAAGACLKKRSCSGRKRFWSGHGFPPQLPRPTLLLFPLPLRFPRFLLWWATRRVEAV